MYTDSLEVCISILIFGDKNISLIHDTGRIHLDGEQSIKTELEFCAAKKVVLCFNKKLIYDKDRSMIIINNIARIKKFISTYSHIELSTKGLDQVTAKNVDGIGLNSVYITREGVIHDGGLAENQLRIAGTTATGALIRKKLNETNNFFLNGTNYETMPADLQFDNETFIPHKGLYKKSDQIDALVNKQEHEKSRRSMYYLQSFAMLFFIFKENKQDEYYRTPNNARNQWSNNIIAQPQYENDPLVAILYETIAAIQAEQIISKLNFNFNSK